MIRACGTWRGGFDPELDLDDAELAAVAAPCLILAGGDDPVGDATVVTELVARLPNATVEVWEGCGHLPWLDDPGRAAAAISSFVVRRSAGSTEA